MFELAFVISVLGMIALLLVLFKSIENEYTYLKILAVAAILFFGIILSSFLVSYEQCDWVLNNTEETFIYGDNYLGYHYDDYNESAPPSLNDVNVFHKWVNNSYVQVCASSDLKSVTLFMKIWYWFARLLAIGLLLAPFIWLIKKKVIKDKYKPRNLGKAQNLGKR